MTEGRNAKTPAARMDAFRRADAIQRQMLAGECDPCARKRQRAAVAYILACDDVRVRKQVVRATGRADWLNDAHLAHAKTAARELEKHLGPRRPAGGWTEIEPGVFV
jgi:hypothetical protein